MLRERERERGRERGMAGASGWLPPFSPGGREGPSGPEKHRAEPDGTCKPQELGQRVEDPARQ